MLDLSIKTDREVSEVLDRWRADRMEASFPLQCMLATVLWRVLHEDFPGLRVKLEAARLSTGCFCDTGDGNPHSGQCSQLQDVLALLDPVASEPTPMNGAGLIATERQRQISAEGWTPEHDVHHANAELGRAAVCYAESAIARISYNTNIPPDRWPWELSWWKPSEDPIRNLVKAGALIAAEIDRLQASETAKKENE